MTYLIWVLRLIHILGGVFWVGGVLTMAFFVGPAVGAVGEAGQKFMAQFVSKSRFPQRTTAEAIRTILAGS